MTASAAATAAFRCHLQTACLHSCACGFAGLYKKCRAAHGANLTAALQEIGHDCTNWSPAVFYDLMRLGDGTGEGVIAAYYNIRGGRGLPGCCCCRGEWGHFRAAGSRQLVGPLLALV